MKTAIVIETSVAICAFLLSGGLELKCNAVEAPRAPEIIRNISVSGTDQNLNVEIDATAPTSPLAQSVTNPDRLIFDFREALPGKELHKVLVNRGNLTDVRVGLLSANPPITRVVLDMTAPTQFRVDSSGSVIVIRLGAPSAQRPVQTSVTTADARPAENTSVVDNAPPVRSTERNWARWILPILVVVTVVGMLVIAIVAHIQNRKGRRGL